jgi:hypothetical protein
MREIEEPCSHGAQSQLSSSEDRPEATNVRDGDDRKELLAGYAGDFGGSSPDGVTPPASADVKVAEPDPQRPVNVIDASGTIRKEPAGYQLKEGEANFDERTQAMRNAVDPSQNDPNQKFGFPYSFFDHAFHSSDPTEVRQQTITVKDGQKIQLDDDGMRDTTHVDRLLNMMPSSMTDDGHLERLSKEQDPAHGGKSDSSAGANEKVSSTKFFESAASLKYAQQQGYDPGTVHRHSATVDFRAENQRGEKVYFDPFMSPQPSQLSGKDRQMREMLNKKNYKSDRGTGVGSSLSDADAKILQKRVDIQTEKLSDPDGNPTYKETPKRWAAGAYEKHTDNKKGTLDEDVTGVWDQTSTPGGHLEKLRDAVAEKGERGRVAHVNLNLAEQYAREDFLAWQQIADRNGDLKPGAE